MVELGSRFLFPDLKPSIYLAHAGVSPLSRPVVAAVEQVSRQLATQGMGAIPEILALRRRLKGQLASLLDCRDEDLALMPGTSWGILAVAQNLDWKSQDRVLLVAGEFPTNITPWQQAAHQYGLELDYLQASVLLEEEGLKKLEAHLQAGVRLLAISAVQFQSGWAMPIARLSQLCHAYGCQIFVDAIQACGIVPLSVQEWQVDYLAGGAHKWLMGSEGCGFLYVHPQARESLQQHWSAWLSHQEPVSFLLGSPGQLRYDRPLQSLPASLELGSSSALSQAALSASLELLLELGVETMFAHVQNYLDQVEGPLESMGFKSLRRLQAPSGILALRPPPGVEAGVLAARLGRSGVEVSTPDGLVRLAPHWPNCPQREVGDLLEAFKNSLEGERQ